MNEAGNGELLIRHFVINPESLHVLHEARDRFLVLQKKMPFLSGLTFFGSRTKGTERIDDPQHKIQKSDYDTWVFFDSRKEGYEQCFVDSTKKEITKTLFPNEFPQLDIPPYNDTAPENTKRIIDEFIGNVNFTRKTKGEIIPGSLTRSEPLSTRFLLGTGEGLYKNRRFILDNFSSMKYGEWYFSILMKELTFYERLSGKVPVPMYPRFPETISDAREFFINKQSGEPAPSVSNSRHNLLSRLFGHRDTGKLKIA